MAEKRAPSQEPVVANKRAHLQEPDKLIAPAVKLDDTRRILEQLQGQMITIPSLHSIFVDKWAMNKRDNGPTAVAKKILLDKLMQLHHDSAPDLPHWIARNDPSQLAYLMFGNTKEVTPEVTPIIQTLSGFVFWQMLWRTKVDDAPDTDAVFRMCENTRVEVMIALSGGQKDARITSAHPCMQFFLWFAFDLYKTQSPNQRLSVVEAISKHVSTYKWKSLMLRSGRIPPWEEYWDTFVLGGGSAPWAALVEYSKSVTLRRRITWFEAYLEMCKSVSIITYLTNDLFSLKKDFDAQHALSAVPVLIADPKRKENTPDAAVDTILDEIRQAIERFNTSRKNVVRVLQAHDKESVEAFVAVAEALIQICVGNWEWSLKTARYGMEFVLLEDGSVKFEIDTGKAA